MAGLQRVAVFTAVALAFIALAVLPLAEAVPSFARQTGLPCNACHTVFPQLTPYGRSFKLEAYTMLRHGHRPELEANQLAPLAVMVQSSLTSTAANQPDTQNGNVLFPDQMSLFFAGRVADHLGAFLQVTYDGVEDHVSMDNADVRFARRSAGGNLLYGLTLNNNPTVEDVWNSTPAWGFPFAASGVAPAPAAATQVDGTLGQQVAGLGGYLWYKSTYYGAATLYRSSQIGNNEPPGSDDVNVIHGVMPYWRLAWSHGWGKSDLELGTFGLREEVYPGGGLPLDGPTDSFLDLAVDGQYQWQPGGPHTVTVRTTAIHERQSWDASYARGGAGNPTDILDTFRVSGSYFWKLKVGGTVAYFATRGDRDTVLYAPGPVDGSRTGSPDSSGVIFELDYLPRHNVKLSAQYTAYSKFNGASSNYDGFGRSASDNDTLYLNLWLMF